MAHWTEQYQLAKPLDIDKDIWLIVFPLYGGRARVAVADEDSIGEFV